MSGIPFIVAASRQSAAIWPSTAENAALCRDAATACWSATEREAWLDAVINDPLLPGRILPSDYLGQQAWRRRVEVLRDAGRQLRTFNPDKIGASRA
jgi:hypothetical protein